MFNKKSVPPEDKLLIALENDENTNGKIPNHENWFDDPDPGEGEFSNIDAKIPSYLRDLRASDFVSDEKIDNYNDDTDIEEILNEPIEDIRIELAQYGIDVDKNIEYIKFLIRPMNRNIHGNSSVSRRSLRKRSAARKFVTNSYSKIRSKNAAIAFLAISCISAFFAFCNQSNILRYDLGNALSYIGMEHAQNYGEYLTKISQIDEKLSQIDEISQDLKKMNSKIDNITSTLKAIEKEQKSDIELSFSSKSIGGPTSFSQPIFSTSLVDNKPEFYRSALEKGRFYQTSYSSR